MNTIIHVIDFSFIFKYTLTTPINWVAWANHIRSQIVWMWDKCAISIGSVANVKNIQNVIEERVKLKRFKCISLFQLNF